MSSSPPFVDPNTGTLDTDQILSEAVPLGKLIGVFVVISLIPFGLAFVFTRFPFPLQALLTVVGQFVLAVGAGTVLLYLIARGMQLSSD